MTHSLPRLLVAVSGLLMFSSPVAVASASAPAHGEITAVFSSVHNGYVQAKRPDGTVQPVTYAFGEGSFDGGKFEDQSLEHLKFNDLIKLLVPPLARQGFQPSREPHKIDQLIVVHWGRTPGWDHSLYAEGYGAALYSAGFEGSDPTGAMPQGAGLGGAISGGSPSKDGMTPDGPSTMMDIVMFQMQRESTMMNLQNQARDAAAGKNARILGYIEKIDDTSGTWGFGAIHDTRRDLLDEVSDDRYYVVLMAYDFPTLLKTKQLKTLWVTRFSLTARGTRFDDNIEGMIKSASKYFGRSSDGLQRTELREGHVNPGPVKVIDYEEPKAK